MGIKPPRPLPGTIPPYRKWKNPNAPIPPVPPDPRLGINPSADASRAQPVTKKGRRGGLGRTPVTAAHGKWKPPGGWTKPPAGTPKKQTRRTAGATARNTKASARANGRSATPRKARAAAKVTGKALDLPAGPRPPHTTRPPSPRTHMRLIRPPRHMP